MMPVDIQHGDCLELLKSVDDNVVDLIVTDPPYKIATSGGGLYTQPNRKYLKDLEGMANGFTPEVLDELCRVMKYINIYFFCSQAQIIPLLDYFVKGKKCNYNLLAWHKTNPVPACANKYLTDTEYILFFREKGVKVFGIYDTKKTFYVTPLNRKEAKMYNHPTVKPVDILQNLIFNSSHKNDIVLDPFMGTGSTGVAALLMGRKFVGCEINEDYYKTAKERLDDAWRIRQINLAV